MSRERSPNREKAFKLWCEGGRSRKLASIARELNVSPELIRKWKHADNWDERPDPGPKRCGAPSGNKNAVGNKGGGAPKRNENAFKHGEYATIWEDVLDPEEQVKLMFVETDPLKQVDNHIRFFELRERRMLQLRAEIMNGWDSTSISSKSESFQRIIEGIGDVPEFSETGELITERRIERFMQETERTKKTNQKLERILAIEQALTSVQDKKMKAIELKCKIEARQLTEEELRVRIEKLKRENKIMAAQEW
ncbi:phage terminase small subunit [Paenibacillus radicis (ex Xue et al. 2023)]|uniref:Phage terminase small subunit n=1 Tax=Paenibacillus radicis (ex Xue et al. 2023) TaxID=2972489 RepID=A0ABT1YUF2_9BACL|nr:phage terminase small subunit [Paenibacillus radicis (ex Xue et al. 2023)]MCR8635760.1 phage terminase small subunit [Paenibacillus radicis (ex Xue et al. 2023)]